MENFDDIIEISEESVAAWLDGNLPYEEDSAFIEQLSSDVRLMEILDACDDVEAEYEAIIDEGYEIPEELYQDFLLPPINSDVFEDDTYDGFAGYETTEHSGILNDSDETMETSCETNSSDSYDEASDDFELQEFNFL